MRRAERADRIGVQLDELYPTTPIPLDHNDPYTLLVAVMLSAQTTDKKVNEVTPALFAVADEPARMAELEVDQIREIIREIGLAPTKAKNLKRMAEQILDGGGEVIPDWEFLESLAGVGHKTASVVMSQAFGVPAFPVDTHIHRLAARWGLSSGRNVVQTERDLKAVFPMDTWNRRHLQIIYFGREYCPARNHDLTGCPICGWAATKKRIREESRR
ncbi:MAG: endonuclease III [Euryarchaeota archaeon]|jgi:endonuclease-3|nr:endonuclease III [Euryarchaeota archaeon]MDC0040502.1 endonuclease III [Candidatus Poseidoniales archaeon]MDP6885584.1 endonuclease III [Candidatus Thalassarchaeaceae archaeon]MDC0149625.1 endonuclease III [Candidatus Poseidoniales archaeon]RCH71312.1 MAG: endonuclease III [Candidatus Poseidoniales archaeon]|tara:strand:- start:691 stop:1338 length:648 start_codon:yes stop_codon:yes gene_type:complete